MKATVTRLHGRAWDATLAVGAAPLAGGNLDVPPPPAPDTSADAAQRSVRAIPTTMTILVLSTIVLIFNRNVDDGSRKP
jgi:hypothetical protein